jgi:hypothetical protein
MNQQKDKKPIPKPIDTSQQVPPPKTKSPQDKEPDNSKQDELTISVQPVETSIAETNESSDEEGQLQIPRPDTVPQRKSSILHPSVHSKLSPTPLIHREEHESVTVL